MEKIAIYPGSFDPVTNGHLDIVERGLKIFDNIIVTIMHNPAKTSLFTVDERFEMMKTSMQDFNKHVEFASFYGLTVDFAAKRNAHAILRGLRAVSDFEYEMQLASMNRHLDNSLETVFMTPSDETSFISASLVKEIALHGGDVSQFVHESIVEALNSVKNKIPG